MNWFSKFKIISQLKQNRTGWCKKKATEITTKTYGKCSHCDSWRMNPTAEWKKPNELTPEELREILYAQKIAPTGISEDGSVMISHSVCDDCWENIYGGDDG